MEFLSNENFLSKIETLDDESKDLPTTRLLINAILNILLGRDNIFTEMMVPELKVQEAPDHLNPDYEKSAIINKTMYSSRPSIDKVPHFVQMCFRLDIWWN